MNLINKDLLLLYLSNKIEILNDNNLITNEYNRRSIILSMKQSYESVKKEIEKGTFDYVDYQYLCTLLINKKLKSNYCGGYFSKDYDLLGATITDIVEIYNGKIQVKVVKFNSVQEIEYFTEWEYLYKNLTNWIVKEN